MHAEEMVFFDKQKFAMPSGVGWWGKISKALFFPIFSRIKFDTPVVDIVMSGDEYSLKELGFEGTILHTPGHTPGSLSLLLESGEAFVGCQAHNGLPFRLTPGLPLFAMSIDKVRESWEILIDRGAKMIFPGHGKPFDIDIMKKVLYPE